MLTSTSSAAIASVLLRATASKAAQSNVRPGNPESPEAWMAPPGDAYENARTQLAKEADAAAKLVTPEVRAAYVRDGVAVVRGVVSKPWLEALKEGCELAQDEAGPFSEYLHKPTDTGIFFTDLELARRLPVFSAFALHGPCAAVAGSVMESSSVRYLYDQLFVKEPGVSTLTPWHQDGGYWRVKGPKICSVFCPMDPVIEDQGLAFVVGSQRWRLHNPQHFADGTAYTGTSLPPMPDINEMIRLGKEALVRFDLSPGDVLVFAATTVHGGPGNWGRALSTRWIGDDARFWDRPGEGAVPTGDIGLREGELLAKGGGRFPEAWRCKEQGEQGAGFSA